MYDRRLAIRFLVPVLLLALLTGCGGGKPRAGAGLAGEERPASWARPVEGPRHLPNLHRVDVGLYRGAQPEDEGFAELSALGVKTVVNVRKWHDEEEDCAEHGLDYVRIPMLAWMPRDRHAVEFLRVAADPERQPVFLHCLRGADRTGMLTAVYRIVVQGWTREEALREMTQGGYGYDPRWRDLVNYVREFDVESVREQAGLGE